MHYIANFRSLCFLACLSLLFSCDVAAQTSTAQPSPNIQNSRQQAESPNPVSGKTSLPELVEGTRVETGKPKDLKTAKNSKVKGSVIVEIVVNEKGKVISAKAISGEKVLQEAAVKAALAARFTPTLLDGSPVKVKGTITYNFGLEDEPSKTEQPPTSTQKP